MSTVLRATGKCRITRRDADWMVLGAWLNSGSTGQASTGVTADAAGVYGGLTSRHWTRG